MVTGAEVRMKETVSCSHMKGGARTPGRGPTVTVVLMTGDQPSRPLSEPELTSRGSFSTSELCSTRLRGQAQGRGAGILKNQRSTRRDLEAAGAAERGPSSGPDGGDGGDRQGGQRKASVNQLNGPWTAVSHSSVLMNANLQWTKYN